MHEPSHIPDEKASVAPADPAPPAIELEQVTKDFRIYATPTQRLLEILTGERRAFHDVKCALKDVTFSLPRGRVMGLIGQNGSGKSTLLKVVAGIVTPTEGRVVTRGRIAAMLDLVSGFNTEFSGRTNIYNKCALLGLSKSEIDERFDEIVRFSGLGNRIEHPIKTYSSGMLLRLGFATTVHTEFDILLIDEVMFVGDEIFSRQCKTMLTQLKIKQNKTIVVTSHSVGQLAEFCDELMYLDAGVPVMSGKAEDVVAEYMRMCDVRYGRVETPICADDSMLCKTESLGSVAIRKVEFLDANGSHATELYTNDPLRIRIHYDAEDPVENPCFRVQFFNNIGAFVHGTNTYRQDLDAGLLEGPGVMELEYPAFSLLEGDYYCNVGIWPDEYSSFAAKTPYDSRDFEFILQVESRRPDGGGVVHIQNTWRHLKRVP